MYNSNRTSSGREIAFFAKEFSLFDFLGTEITEENVNYFSAEHVYDNLSFALIDCRSTASFIFSADYEEYVIFSSGSMQYVNPEHLN